MRVKTSELLGASLDWAVAKCEGDEIVLDLDGSWDSRTISHQHYSKKLKFNNYRPSESWAQGGQIIEREGIQIQKHLSGWIALPIGAAFSEEEYQEGETPLIAAMRCYVANKLGEEVDIPEEVNT